MRHTKAKCALLFHSMVQLSSSGDWSGITFAKLFRYYLVAFVYKCIAMPFQKSLLSDDYENELELYSVLGFNPVDESCMGKVCIYDNDSGHQIKSFDLGMSLDELCDYTLTLDLDTLVVLVKDERRHFWCFLYRLQYPGVVEAPRPKRSARSGSVGLRRSQRTSNSGVNSNNIAVSPLPPSARVLRSRR